MQQLVPTGDGSLSRFNDEAGELYHNKIGAYTEALKHYFEPSAAVEVLQKNGELGLLDVCFGLGYNSFVLLDQIVKAQLPPGKVKVVAIELDPEIISFLPQILDQEILADLRGCMENTIKDFGSYAFKTPTGVDIQIQLLQGDVRKVVPLLDQPVDLIFHDPFSTLKMPELWSVDLFRHYARLTIERRGKVMTYSTARSVRTGFFQAGFEIWDTAPLGGKRGGTVAAQPDALMGESVTRLAAAEVAKLSARTAIPYRDKDLCQTREHIFETRIIEQASG
jgi:tRNA U34 5-methylaminomethyl-2-thiouridine-forming methyltransferase MnmC